MTPVQLIELITFAFILWLGLYLIARDYDNPLTRYSGLGAAAYGVVLAVSFLGSLPDSPPYFVKLGWSLLFFPAFFWSNALVYLEKDPTESIPSKKKRAYSLALIGTVLASIALFVFPILWNELTQRPTILALSLLGTWLITPLLSGLRAITRITKSGSTAFVGIRAVLIATVFFTLGSGLVIFPLGIFSPGWILLAIALDFEILGIAVAWLDAFNLGERLLPDFSRSLIVSLFLAILFGVQIAFIIALSTGLTFLMVLIFHLTITAAILVGIFIDEIQNFVETRLGTSWAVVPGDINLRATARAQVRIPPASSSYSFDDETLYRYARRALSDYGNLSRLISNPLINLPIVSIALNDAGGIDNPLERSKILKSLIKNAILQLKPGTTSMFGETEEWRFYNSLYFPYILGLRPYRRKIPAEELDPYAKLALNWFRTSVPERTLYNWQKSAARLVAQQLREKNPNETP